MTPSLRTTGLGNVELIWGGKVRIGEGESGFEGRRDRDEEIDIWLGMWQSDG